MENDLEELLVFKPEKPTIATQIQTYSIKEIGSDEKYKKLPSADLLYVDLNGVKKKVFCDVNGTKLQVCVDNKNELYYINPKDGKSYSINKDTGFYYYDLVSVNNVKIDLDNNKNKFYKFNSKNLKHYEKIENFNYQNEKIKLDISINKNQQVEITFDFVQQMKKEVEKIKKQRKKLSQIIEENEYLTALKEIYKKSYNKYTENKSESLISYISERDKYGNDTFVIGPINQDESGVDYFFKGDAFAEKIKKYLQSLMKAIDGLDVTIKKEYGFGVNTF